MVSSHPGCTIQSASVVTITFPLASPMAVSTAFFLYEFTVSYTYQSGEILKLIIDGKQSEILQKMNPGVFMLYLTEGQTVLIRIANPGSGIIFYGIGSFMGHRINQ